MSLYKEWKNLTDNQTNATFDSFWKEYCDAEIRIYSDILKDPKTATEGTFEELRGKYDIKAPLFMGFLDGVSASLLEELPPLESVDAETALRILVDPEKLYYNMHAAEASHLYELDVWDEVLPEEKRQQIGKDYRRSKTVIKEKKPGRNDPCPCGSGRKYKQCCGKA